METITEAKEFLRENWEKGTHCPTCDQFVKVYKRPISSTAAYALILVYRYFIANPDAIWLHVPTYLGDLKIPAAVKNTGEFSRLAHWDLIEFKPVDDNDAGKHSGMARLTDRGRQFVEGRIAVEQYLHFYNKQIIKRSLGQVTIQEALRENFDYGTLMAREVSL